jgi:hypothetical protein
MVSLSALRLKSAPNGVNVQGDSARPEGAEGGGPEFEFLTDGSGSASVALSFQTKRHGTSY